MPPSGGLLPFLAFATRLVKNCERFGHGDVGALRRNKYSSQLLNRTIIGHAPLFKGCGGGVRAIGLAYI